MRYLVLMFAGSLGCSLATEEAPERPVKSTLRPRNATVRRPSSVALLEGPAVVVPGPGSSAEIGVLFEARLETLQVRPGDRVSKGDPVAEVRSPSLAQAAAEYRSARASLAVVRQRLAFVRPLRKEGLTGMQTVFDLEMEAARLDGLRAHAVARLRGSGVPRTAWSRLGQGDPLVLRSPISGLVTEVNHASGEVVGSEGPPIARVLGAAKPRVEARLDISPKRTGTIELRLPDGGWVSAKPVLGAEAIDAATGAHRVWLEAETTVALPEGLNLTARVRPAPGVFEVPADSVDRRGKEVRLWRPSSPPEAVPVKVILSNTRVALVEGPLRAGELVLANPTLELSESNEASP